MIIIQKLYEVDRTCREQNLSPARRKVLRLEESLPVLNQMGRWMHGQAAKVLPKSLMGKAISYSAKRWEKLSCYLHDGRSEEHTSELQSRGQLVCRLLLDK